LKDKVKKDKKYIKYLLYFIFIPARYPLGTAGGLLYLLFIYYLCLKTSGTMDNLYMNYKIELATTSSFLPLKIYKDLSRPEEFKAELNKIGGVYGFIHLPDNKQYIGSSSDLYKRFKYHLKGISSNIRLLALASAISKSGLNNFIFVIYHFHNNPNTLLTDIETAVIKSFPFENLYNFKREAISMLNYKHTAEAIEKMRKRFFNKKNHPMFGKKHTLEALKNISKPGVLNPMFNKKHSINTKNKMSISRSKIPLGLYDKKNNLIKTFINQVELANEFNVNKSTISRYIRSGKFFQDKFIIRKLDN
jgi:group I intron endonuclease